MQHESGDLIGGRGLLIDEDQVVTLEIMDEASSQIAGKRGAAHDQRVRRSELGACLAQHLWHLSASRTRAPSGLMIPPHEHTGTPEVSRI